MTNTPNLLIAHVGDTAQKAPPTNAALDAFDNAFNEVEVIDLTSGDVILTDTQYLRRFLLRCTGGPGADRTITVGAQKRLFAIHNQFTTKNSIFLDTATTGGSQVEVTRGTLAICHSDGENVVVLGQQGATPYDIGMFVPLLVEDSVLSQFVTPRPFTLLQNLPDSQAFAMTEPTTDEDDVVIEIQRNAVQVGSVIFPSGSQVGVFVFSATVNFVEGDVLQLVAPPYDTSQVESAIRNISVTLRVEV